MPETGCWPCLSPAAASDLMTIGSGLRRACASGFRSANLIDAHMGPRSPQTVTTAILPPWDKPPPQTRGPERLGLSELGPGRLPIYQRANRPLEDRRKETRRPNPHPLAWRKKPRVGCHCHGHSGPFLLTRHLPNSRGCRREGVNLQNRKVQLIILDPPLYPTSSGNHIGPSTVKACPFSRSLDRSYGPLPARCTKLFSFFSAFPLPFRALTRWHLEGHSPAKTQTNCDSDDIKPATFNTAWRSPS